MAQINWNSSKSMKIVKRLKHIRIERFSFKNNAWIVQWYSVLIHLFYILLGNWVITTSGPKQFISICWWQHRQGSLMSPRIFPRSRFSGRSAQIEKLGIHEKMNWPNMLMRLSFRDFETFLSKRYVNHIQQIRSQLNDQRDWQFWIFIDV